VLLKDVGHAEVGAEDYSSSLKYSGRDAMGIGVEQLSNANALDVDRQAKAVLEELKRGSRLGSNMPSRSIRLLSSRFHSRSDGDLGRSHRHRYYRDLLVPSRLARNHYSGREIPVSLIGTFAFIKLFGFSINSLTLFGITLATGLVVDDAIVVIENVQRHIAMEHSDPHEATSRAMAK